MTLTNDLGCGTKRKVLATSNIHVKYESSSTNPSKVMANVKVFLHTKREGDRLSNRETDKKTDSQTDKQKGHYPGLSMWGHEKVNAETHKGYQAQP